MKITINIHEEFRTPADLAAFVRVWEQVASATGRDISTSVKAPKPSVPEDFDDEEFDMPETPENSDAPPAEKPKRRRRTKAEIEVEKAAKTEAANQPDDAAGLSPATDAEDDGIVFTDNADGAAAIDPLDEKGFRQVVLDATRAGLNPIYVNKILGENGYKSSVDAWTARPGESDADVATRLGALAVRFTARAAELVAEAK